MANILIVDDEPDVVSVVRMTLARAGHSVHAAFDGRRALKRLGLDGAKPSQQSPDLAILDLVMPGLNGYELSTRMRLSERTADVPVILLTARAEMTEVFGGAANVVGQVQKPFEPAELLQAVERALGAGATRR